MPQTYRIGEVAELLGLKTSVLRFWESTFPQLEALRTAKGQRLYTEDHVRLIRRIQELVHEQGLTLDGARRILDGERRKNSPHAPLVAQLNLLPTNQSEPAPVHESPSADAEEALQMLRRVRSELQDMRSLLRPA